MTWGDVKLAALQTMYSNEGAVLTEDYARTIGADAYCRDAMASVNYAEQVFGA